MASNTFLMFTPIWGNDPIWSNLFKGVETNNYRLLMILTLIYLEEQCSDFKLFLFQNHVVLGIRFTSYSHTPWTFNLIVSQWFPNASTQMFWMFLGANVLNCFLVKIWLLNGMIVFQLHDRFMFVLLYPFKQQWTGPFPPVFDIHPLWL